MTMFASKTPRDLNHDPYPYVTYRDLTGTLGPQALWRSGNRVDGAGYFTKLEPRPEFDHVQHNEPNPLLADYRLDIAHTGWRDRDPRDWLKEVTTRFPGVTFPWSSAQIDHARRVLTRLAASEEN